jgi:quercetin dioxygenase-like cupin family protein
MRRYAFPLIAALAALSCFPLLAQTPGAPAPALVPTEDPGVARAVLIDRPEIRVLRVEIQPGAVRRVHQHDDVRYHLFLPITPGVEVTVGSDKPRLTAAGQAVFMQKGTPHGFRNTGSTVAMVFEVFIRPDAPVANRTPVAMNKSDAIALALALASLPPNKP